MVALLTVATVADIAIAVLLVAVSGFILQGVNNTGPASGAAWYVAFIVFCLAAPAAAWILRKRASAAISVLLALAPIVVGVVVLALEPIFA